MLRCLIADDHAMMRAALAGAVRFAVPDAEISEVGDFPAAWAAATATAPGLIVCDLAMPGATPVAGVTRLRALVPACPILVVTGSEEDAVLLALLAADIAGFAPKTSDGAVIEAAIRLVLAGGRFLPPRLAELALGVASAAPPPRLTERQRDILHHIAAGRSNKEIARELDLSPATIKVHAAAAFAALGTDNRHDAVTRARTLGLF
ncbi:hypothetical protein IP88_10530 [alpha proteobacterium AAP81b]|nr:hypothetical protein IP88_10530 [alpha proteobacterium AAP81b]